jgi:hypothetical protein
MNILFLYGFLTGIFSTLIVGYYYQKFTGSTGALEKIQNKKFDLEKLFNEHPHFMNTIKNDMNDPNSKNIREFFVVEKDALLNMSTPRLRYDLSEEILPALDKLEECGYIEKLKNNCLHYKIREDFIVQLKAMNLEHSFERI